MLWAAMAGRARRPVRVPNLRGMATSDASGLLREAGLRAGLVHLTFSRDFDAGTVFDQEPAAGVNVERGQSVDLTVSSGLR
jgi:eukaryotic-like serine/threonine-protein kinase